LRATDGKSFFIIPRSRLMVLRDHPSLFSPAAIESANSKINLGNARVRSAPCMHPRAHAFARNVPGIGGERFPGENRGEEGANDRKQLEYLEH